MTTMAWTAFAAQGTQEPTPPVKWLEIGTNHQRMTDFESRLAALEAAMRTLNTGDAGSTEGRATTASSGARTDRADVVGANPTDRKPVLKPGSASPTSPARETPSVQDLQA